MDFHNVNHLHLYERLMNCVYGVFIRVFTTITFSNIGHSLIKAPLWTLSHRIEANALSGPPFQFVRA